MAYQIPLRWYKTLQTRLEGYPPAFIDVLFFTPIGFIGGFALKMLGRYFIGALIITALTLWIADYFALITIHYEDIKELLGLSPDFALNNLTTSLTEWAKDHFVACLALLVGFFIGWKLG